jgi:hypothetical protein
LNCPLIKNKTTAQPISIKDEVQYLGFAKLKSLRHSV